MSQALDPDPNQCGKTEIATNESDCEWLLYLKSDVSGWSALVNGNRGLRAGRRFWQYCGFYGGCDENPLAQQMTLTSDTDRHVALKHKVEAAAIIEWASARRH